MEYMSCPEAAKKWGISERRVQRLCEDNRIHGISKIGYMWLIPKDTQKLQMAAEKKISLCEVSVTFGCYAEQKGA